jgi:hypothetical protein
MKKLIFFLLVCFSKAYAQVGVNTTSPKAALQIATSSPTAVSPTDGLLVPRIDSFPTTNPGADQQSMLVYLKNTAGGKPPGFYFWDNPTSSWNGISTGTGLTQVNTVFNDLVNVNPAIATKVYCSGYWDKNDQGGGIFEWDASSTKEVDGGRYFASKLTSTGRWVRKVQNNVSVLHYGAIPVRNFFAGNNGNFGYGGVYFRNDIPVTWSIDPLSTKFANLAEAQAWYPRSVTALTDAIDAAAIQSVLEYNSECYIPEGVYVLNKALQFARHRKIYGANTVNTVLHFIDCSGFMPKISVQNNATDNNFIYLFNSSISDLSIIGNGLPTITSQLATAAFDSARCGINFPNDQRLPEANSNETPLANAVSFSRIRISNFAGHGLKMLSHFTCSFDFVDVQNCGGHGIYIQGGNTTSLRSCYVHAGGVGYASYRILGGAVMIACNGNDSPNNTWGIFGMDTNYGDEITSGVSSTFHLTQCNFEGMKRGLELRGTFTKVMLDACQLFPYNLDPAEPFFIIDRAYESTVRLSNCYYFLNGATPLEALIKAEGNNVGSNYMILGDYLSALTPTGFNKVKYTNTAGVNTYGPGALFDIPIITATNPAYATKAISVNEFAAKSIYLGKNVNETTAGTGAAAQILTGSGVPTVAATDGSIYLRTDGGAGATLFVRENGAWVAK